jgi:hypothetical protein
MENIREPAEQAIEIGFFAGFFAKIICRRLRRLVKFVNPSPGFRFAVPGAILSTPAPQAQAFKTACSKLRIAGRNLEKSENVEIEDFSRLLQTFLDFSRLF